VHAPSFSSKDIFLVFPINRNKNPLIYQIQIPHWTSESPVVASPPGGLGGEHVEVEGDHRTLHSPSSTTLPLIGSVDNAGTLNLHGKHFEDLSTPRPLGLGLTSAVYPASKTETEKQTLGPGRI